MERIKPNIKFLNIHEDPRGKLTDARSVLSLILPCPLDQVQHCCLNPETLETIHSFSSQEQAREV
jgi:hypothetical protein